MIFLNCCAVFIYLGVGVGVSVGVELIRVRMEELGFVGQEEGVRIW